MASKLYNSIAAEVRATISKKLKAGQTVHVQFLTHEIVAAKDLPDNDDAGFFRACAYNEVKRVVRRCIGKFDTPAKSEPWEQVTLDGFDHLQIGYTVERDDQRVLVPIEQVTDEELLQRAHEYGVMAQGCVKHKKEIKFYVANRQQMRDAA